MLEIAIFSTDPEQVVTKHYVKMLERHNQFFIKLINPSSIEKINESKVVIIPPYSEEYKYISTIRSYNKCICFLDPRNKNQAKNIASEDIVLLDSVEQYDLVSKYTDRIIMYYEFPLMELGSTFKDNSNRKNINIYYHGNKVHLEASKNTLIRAISMLERDYDISFHACYNYEKLGKAKIKLRSIVHHQWVEGIHHSLSNQMDIGVCPNFIPIRLPKVFKKIISSRSHNSHEDDYIHRFKIPSNPGRIITMIMMGLPVISDMFPSAAQTINHSVNGYLVSSYAGWYSALKKYINSKELRQQHAELLMKYYQENFEPFQQNSRLEVFIKRYLSR